MGDRGIAGRSGPDCAGTLPDGSFRRTAYRKKRLGISARSDKMETIFRKDSSLKQAGADQDRFHKEMILIQHLRQHGGKILSPGH